MSEKISIKDHRGDSVEWALLVAITPRRKDADIEAALVPGEPLEVELRINGVEVKFSPIIERLKGVFDRCVGERAVEIVSERAGKLDDATRRVHEAIEAATRKFAAELGVELPED